MLPELRTILYATDMGVNASKVFKFALALARGCDAEIHLLHVIEQLGPTARSLMHNTFTHDELRRLRTDGYQRVHEEIHRRLKEIVEEELGTPEESAARVAQISVLEGHPDRVILQRAGEIGANLIVMGSHTGAGLQHALLGSVARKVVHRSTIPVVLVPIPAES